MRILIAGGGIGGLTAALCLAKSGHELVLLEQAKSFNEMGAGLQCGANAVRVLQYLELDLKLQSFAVNPERIEFRDYLHADLLYEIELGEGYRQRFGAPYYHLHRADLVSVLFEAVKCSAQIELRMGSQVTEYTEFEDGVSVTLKNKECLQGELLIACDGIKSNIRQQMYASEKGNTQPRFTGNAAWRAVVPAERLSDDFMHSVVTNFVGPKKHMVLYYLRNRTLLNLVGVVENPSWRDDSWVAKAPWEELRDDFSGWHPMVIQAINALDKEACYRWALFDHKPLDSWGTDRVTLLGDAAHATLPFMASGAALAIEDARILQRCLDKESSVKQALALYQKNRQNRTARVQNTSRKFGTLYHIQNRLLLKAAFAGLRVMGGKKENFLPEYDANTVALD